LKVAFVVDQFPVLSQTFVLNQITSLIDLGIDVTVISLQRAFDDLDQHDVYREYKLQSKAVFLLPEQKQGPLRLLQRAWWCFSSVLDRTKRKQIIDSLNSSYGANGRSLLLGAIIAKNNEPLVFDYVVCHFGYNGIVTSKLKKLGVVDGQLATIFHGFELSAASALNQYKREYEKLYAEHHLLLPISELWKEKLIKLGADPEQTFVQRMGVDLQRFKYQAIKKVPKKKIKVFTVARFSEKKGLKYAIEAIALLSKEFSIEYRLAGFGELETEIRELISNLNINTQVTLLGSITQEAVIEELCSADVFLQPSVVASNGDMEGVPVTIMEAMAIGTPVVSTFHSGIPELITDRIDGILANERDSKGLAEGIKALVTDESLYCRISRSARERVEEIADTEKLATELIELLTLKLGQK